MRKSIIVILFVIFYSLPGYAFFEKDIRILTMQNGLADNTVSCIHKDRDGFMWFGTDNGLSRYDGKNIKNFSLDSLYMKVFHINETENGLLWVIADRRLFCFDRRMERFIPVRGAEKCARVQDILMQDDSSFWSISPDVLSFVLIDYKTDKGGNITEVNLTVEKEFPNLAGSDTDYMAFCQSPEGIIYIGTEKGNIITFDPATFHIIGKIDQFKEGKIHIVNLLYSEGCIWIATWVDGVICYNLKSGTYSQYSYNPEDKDRTLSHGDVYQVVPLSSEHYFVATWNGYTVLVPDKDNPTHLITKVYNNTASQLHRNLETRMISAYYDPEGIIWVGTQGGGVYASDLRKQFYKRFHQDTHNEICGMATDKKQRIWLASFHKGILRSSEPFDPQSHLSFESIPSGTGNTVLCVVSDRKGDLWFGNSQSELIWYHSGNERITVLPIRLADGSHWTGSVWSLVFDSQERLWLGTSNGLLLFDPATKLFKHYPVHSGVIRAMVEVPGKCLWLGTSYGLKKFSFPENVIQSGFEKQANIPAWEVRSLFASSDGKLYIGFAEGFGIMDLSSDTIESYFTTRNGLSSNFIGCISEDSKGHLWLGSNSSVSRYSKHQKLFYNYYVSGNNRSVMLYKDYLFWGNNKNITYFLPDKAMNDYLSNEVVITQLEVDNKHVGIGQKVNGQIILKKGIPYTKKLTLTATNNNFSLMFSNLTYSEDLQKYGYRLTPAQTDWLVAGDGDKVSYTNLPRGEYVFEVRSIFPDGSNGDITSLAVKILPYWYETFWFGLLVFIFAVIIVYYLIKHLKRKQMRLAQEERLKHELLIVNLEREKEKQISLERENFFTNVSHELRTPLTLILSPLQELLQTERFPQILQDKLSLVYNNASSLFFLVNQLLYVQKIEAGMVHLSLSKVEIVALVKQVMNSFKHMAEIKKTKYVLNSGIQFLELWIDAAKIESALKNLLSNAFKYTPSCGIIEVSLEEKEVDGKMFCLISVTDNGPGIAEDLQERIFDSFITGKNDPSFSTKVGIGLRIVKNTMNIHHGQVVLDSSPGEGAKFTLYLPIGKEHFKDDECEWVENVVKPKENETFYVPQLRDKTMETNSYKKLLIVEDNDEIRKYIHTLFNKDYQVLEACNGDEGVRIAIDEIPDLIISDIMMPVKDGFICCMEIRSNLQTSHIPIIMLTAKAEEEDLLKGLRIGVDDYLMKPFNPEILKAKVENLIYMRKQLKRIYTKTLMLKHTAENSDGEEQTDPFMQQVICIVEANLTNPDFSAKMLAELLNLSQPTLYRKMKQQSNLSIIEAIRSIRMSKAASLIIQKKYSVQEIAEMVGYNDVNTFRKHFTNQFGVSPSRYI